MVLALFVFQGLPMSSTVFGAIFEFAGKPIEVLRVGTFIDGRGREVTITGEDLDTFVANFDSGAAGQDIPIDIDHEMEQAAGWLKSMKRVGDILTVVPDWNDLGRELVGKKIYRYISATIDMAKRVILTISLVNLPAVKGLKPVELSEPPVEGNGELHLLSTDAAESIYFFKEFSMKKDTATNVVDQSGASTEQDSGTQVAANGAQTATDTAAGTVSLSQTATGSGNNTTALTQSATNQVAAAQTTDATHSAQDSIAALRQQMSAEMNAFKSSFLAEMAKLADQRAAIMSETIAQLRDEQAVAEFSMRVTSTGKFAIPQTPGELQATLLSIPKPHREHVMAMLKAIHENGLVDFGEVGTSAGKSGKRELDPSMKRALTMFTSGGGKVEDFFKLNEDLLGSMADYNL